MKFKYFILMLFAILSFYLSDKILLYVENLNPIMKTINQSKEDYNVLPVNAIINGNNIITGINGKEVNDRKSFLKMNEFGSFNEMFYVYDNIKPEISLYDNLDKYIISSNKIKNVAIITNSINVSDYLYSIGINHSLIIYNSIDIKENIEYINGLSIIKDYKKLERYMNKNNINNKICILSYNDIEYCKTKKYLLVNPSIMINNNNYNTNINKISGGNIIFLDSNISTNIIDNVINTIKKDNLEIIKLSYLINE